MKLKELIPILSSSTYISIIENTDNKVILSNKIIDINSDTLTKLSEYPVIKSDVDDNGFFNIYIETKNHLQIFIKNLLKRLKEESDANDTTATVVISLADESAISLPVYKEFDLSNIDIENIFNQRARFDDLINIYGKYNFFINKFELNKIHDVYITTEDLKEIGYKSKTFKYDIAITIKTPWRES